MSHHTGGWAQSRQVLRSATVAMTSASMAITNVAFANVDWSLVDMGAPPFEPPAQSPAVAGMGEPGHRATATADDASTRTPTSHTVESRPVAMSKT